MACYLEFYLTQPVEVDGWVFSWIKGSLELILSDGYREARQYGSLHFGVGNFQYENMAKKLRGIKYFSPHRASHL